MIPNKKKADKQLVTRQEQEQEVSGHWSISVGVSTPFGRLRKYWRGRKQVIQTPIAVEPVVTTKKPVLITSIGFPPPTPSSLRSPKLWGVLGFVVAVIVYIFFTNRRK